MIKIIKWKEDNRYEKSINNLLKESFASKKDLIPNKTMVVMIVENNDIMGLICLVSNNDLIKFLEKKMLIEDIGEMYSIRAAKGVYIYNLSVSKKYRKRGIGTRLIKIAIYISRYLKFKYCHVHSENAVSEKMFNRERFFKEKYYNNGKSKVSLQTFWL